MGRLRVSWLGVLFAALAGLAPLASARGASWVREARASLLSDDITQVGKGATLCVQHDSKLAARTLAWALAHPPSDVSKLRKKYAQSVKSGNAPVGLGRPQRPTGGAGPAGGRGRPGGRGGGPGGGPRGLPAPRDGGESERLAKKLNAREATQRYCVWALGRLRSAEAVQWLETKGLKHPNRRVRAEVACALGKIGRQSSVEPVAAAARGSNPLVRMLSIEALAALGAKTQIEPLRLGLDDQAWQVRVAAVQSAARLDASPVAGTLVEMLRREKGRLVGDVLGALRSISGQDFGHDLDAWDGWWQANRETLEAGIYRRPSQAGTTTARAGKHLSTFFGIPVDTKRTIFVIDYSLSMRQSFTRTRTDATGETKVPNVAGETRLAEAQEQTIRALMAFPTDAMVGVILFHYGVDVLGSGPMRATGATKNRLRAALLARRLRLGTNIFDALDRAFDVDRRGQLTHDLRSPVDTIYLLSDGAPTSGRTAAPQQMVEMVRFWNRTRKIRIHTVLIREPTVARGRGRGRQGRGPDSLMRTLARDSGGTYVRLSGNGRREVFPPPAIRPQSRRGGATK